MIALIIAGKGFTCLCEFYASELCVAAAGERGRMLLGTQGGAPESQSVLASGSVLLGYHNLL